jgi:hypothetical protein
MRICLNIKFWTFYGVIDKISDAGWLWKSCDLFIINGNKFIINNFHNAKKGLRWVIHQWDRNEERT